MSVIMSLVGMAVLIAIAFIFSVNKRAINPRTVFGAFALQFCIGAFVLYVPWGQTALGIASDGVKKVIDYGNEGVSFLLGGLVSDKMFELFGGSGFIFAFRVLPMIIFFSSLIAVLYYLGIMSWIIRIIGGALHKLLGTSRAESMSAAANIFVGQTEAPLVVKPFVRDMTQSELFAIMCGGLASIAGSVLGGYAQMGVEMKYLLAASFMAAPGGLLFAKLLVPETQVPPSNENLTNNFSADADSKPANVIDAAADGASSGMQLAINVAAMLLAFVALIALINGIFGGIGSLIGMPDLSLDKIFGWLFAPLAWLIGTPWSEAQVAGTFLGQKLAINEFVAYANFQPYLQGATDIVLTEKTKAIISFALCGFANFSSIAILVGGLSIMAPNRRKDVARFAMPALLAGTLSNLMSATIAGLFIGLGG
ncbi:NupC/NupG family nucleoside CNT transporter [Suttonella ornithocola]|uniref:Nucleoside permease n=1 Tax=Suttonella ornithocola TaxID=279832 RepID=A0A380MUG4_9GAMM|nr:NupC/NupG family nucleoside CNT transporter [Suttonella ornithocola]SUO96240.1 Nucleoside permease nupX [Suttonella ornithocola]